MHQGHEKVECECGKVIRQCRCIDQFKSTRIQRPCKCEGQAEPKKCACAKCDASAVPGQKLCHLCDVNGCKI